MPHLNTQALHSRNTRDFSVRTAACAADTEPPRKQPTAGVGGGDDGPGGASSATDLVTEVLGKIEGTNRGVDCTPKQREEIDVIIEQVGADHRR